jgi:hypothetical protein
VAWVDKAVCDRDAGQVGEGIDLRSGRLLLPAAPGTAAWRYAGCGPDRCAPRLERDKDYNTVTCAAGIAGIAIGAAAALAYGLATVLAVNLSRRKHGHERETRAWHRVDPRKKTSRWGWARDSSPG